MESVPEMTSMVTTLARTTRIDDPGRVPEGRDRPDPEVPERARRRTFTAKYKLEILAAYDAAPDGEKGALLRREGLYSSHITEWRRARDAGALAGLAAPRGRKPRDSRDERIAALQADKQRLEQELARARFVVDVQAKLRAYAGDRCQVAAASSLLRSFWYAVWRVVSPWSSASVCWAWSWSRNSMVVVKKLHVSQVVS